MCPGWGDGSAQYVFVPGNLDLFEQRTKHVFPVNLAQIRSGVPEIFDSQTKKKQKSHRQR